MRGVLLVLVTGAVVGLTVLAVDLGATLVGGFAGPLDGLIRGLAELVVDLAAGVGLVADLLAVSGALGLVGAVLLLVVWAGLVVVFGVVLVRGKVVGLVDFFSVPTADLTATAVAAVAAVAAMAVAAKVASETFFSFSFLVSSICG